MIQNNSPQSRINIGDQLPNANIRFQNGMSVNIRDIFKTGPGVLFGVPGSFSPECTLIVDKFKTRALKWREQGRVSFVGCLVVNDPFVLKAWAKSLNMSEEIVFICDCNGQLASRLGMLSSFASLGMGMRSSHFALVLNDEGRVTWCTRDVDEVDADIVAQHLPSPPNQVAVMKIAAQAQEKLLDTLEASISEEVEPHEAIPVQMCGGGDPKIFADLVGPRDETGGVQSMARWNYKFQGDDWQDNPSLCPQVYHPSRPTEPRKLKQSPINIRTSEVVASDQELVIKYQHRLTNEEIIVLRGEYDDDMTCDRTARYIRELLPSAYKIVNTGRVIEIFAAENPVRPELNPPFMPVTPFGCWIETEGRRWALSKIALHAPSEHTVDGENNRADLEVYLIHNRVPNAEATSASFAADDVLVPYDMESDRTLFQKQLIISIRFVAEQDADQPFLASLLSLPRFPVSAGTELVQPRGDTLDDSVIDLGKHLMNMLIAEDAECDGFDEQRDANAFWRYDGSMTTPPCVENVQWFIAQRPLVADPDILLAFADFLRPPDSKGNYRNQQNLPGTIRNEEIVCNVAGVISHNS